MDHRAASQALVSRTVATLYPDVESSCVKTDVFSEVLPQLMMRSSSDKPRMLWCEKLSPRHIP